MKFHTVDVQGKFWTERVADKDTTRHQNVIDEGRIIYSEADGKLYYGARSDWKQVMGKYDFITSQTKMMFGYFPLPDGWNIITNKNEVLIDITITGDGVGDIEGTWTIQGIRSPQAGSNSHTHTIVEDGVHIHGFDINWRPAHIKFAEARFD